MSVRGGRMLKDNQHPRGLGEVTPPTLCCHLCQILWGQSVPVWAGVWGSGRWLWCPCCPGNLGPAPAVWAEILGSPRLWLPHSKPISPDWG